MYKYGMLHRPFSIGCQPMNGLIERQDAAGIVGSYGREYHDILIYSRKLTDEELNDYEMEEISA